MDTAVETGTEQLLARLARREAQDAVRRAIAECAQSFDRRDAQRFAAVWSERATWSVGPGHEVCGLPAIRDEARKMWAQVGPTHHWASNPVIDVHGSDAVAETEVQAVVRGADGTWTLTAGTYRDRFEWLDGSWLLVRRATDIHRTFPVAEPIGPVAEPAGSTSESTGSASE